MYKKQYESPEMQIIMIAGDDIITSSGDIDSGIVGGDD